MVSVSQAPRRYWYEMALAFILYAAALFGRVELLKHTADPVLKAIITLSPIVPILLMAVAVYRFYRAMDEFHRMRMLKVAAIASGITAIAAASWSFLEDVGAPKLTNFGAFFILYGAFALVSFLFRVEDAAAEGKIGQPVRIVSWASTFLLAAASLWYVVAFFSGQPWSFAFAVAVVAGIVHVCVSLHLGPSTGIV